MKRSSMHCQRLPTANIRTIADSKEQQQQQQQQPHIGTSLWPTGRGLAKTIISCFFVYIGYCMYIAREFREHPIRVFERGDIDYSDELTAELDKTTVQKAMIPTDEERARLAAIVHNAREDSYVVITGDCGTGKSTLAEDLCKSNSGGCVLVRGSKGQTLAASLGSMFCLEPGPVHAFTPRELRRPRPLTAPEMKIGTLLEVVEDAALGYIKRHHRQPILIVDSIDDVSDIKEVYALQDQAKLWADKRMLTVVFVMRASQTLAEKRYRIGGIAEPAAIDYLVKHHFTKDDAQRVVRELTGDRLYHLLDVRDMSKLKFEDIRKSVFDQLENHFEELRTQDKRGTFSGAEAILKSPTKSISIEQFDHILEQQKPDAWAARRTLLLKSQVFALTGG